MCRHIGECNSLELFYFTYVLRVVVLDVTKRCGEIAREKTSGNTNGLSHVLSKRKEEIKPGTSGCGSFVVPYFHPAASIDRLHLALRSGLEVGKPSNIPANNKRASNGHSHRG